MAMLSHSEAPVIFIGYIYAHQESDQPQRPDSVYIKLQALTSSRKDKKLVQQETVDFEEVYTEESILHAKQLREPNNFIMEVTHCAFCSNDDRVNQKNRYPEAVTYLDGNIPAAETRKAFYDTQAQWKVVPYERMPLTVQPDNPQYTVPIDNYTTTQEKEIGGIHYVDRSTQPISPRTPTTSSSQTD